MNASRVPNLITKAIIIHSNQKYISKHSGRGSRNLGLDKVLLNKNKLIRHIYLVSAFRTPK